jgi:hypothetical protein
MCLLLLAHTAAAPPSPIRARLPAEPPICRRPTPASINEVNLIKSSEQGRWSGARCAATRPWCYWRQEAGAGEENG